MVFGLSSEICCARVIAVGDKRNRERERECERKKEKIMFYANTMTA